MKNLASMLTIVFILLVVGVVVATYIRVYVLGDYLIQYSLSCDPEIESCFVLACEEEGCEPEYYKLMERNAGEIRAQCGEDVIGCVFAESCASAASYCKEISCDSETETCDNVTASVDTES